jgi:hypothetical protein
MQVKEAHGPYSPSFSLSIHLAHSYPSWTCCIILSFIIHVFINCSKGFCHGISHIYILCFSQIKFLCFSLFLYLPCPPIIWHLSVCFLCLPHILMQCVSKLFTFCHSHFFSHFLLVSSNSATIRIIFYLSIYRFIYLPDHVIMFGFMYTFIF